jgi:hypothetical protein
MRPASRGASAKAVAMLGALCAAFITTALAAETSIPLINPGFESHKPGARGNPEGWVSIQHAGDVSYTFRMDDAPVRGSTDWQRYAIEIDVPAAADQIELGTMLHGPGAMWLDDVMLEIVADRS